MVPHLGGDLDLLHARDAGEHHVVPRLRELLRWFSHFGQFTLIGHIPVGGGHFCGRVARLATSQGLLDVLAQRSLRELLRVERGPLKAPGLRELLRVPNASFSTRLQQFSAPTAIYL